MSTADVYLGFCAIIAQVFHILWILAAWKAYYNRYFDYKLVLQSVAFVNFLCALVFNWFLDIEVMFPLPAVTVSGFFKFLPYTMISRMITVAVTVFLATVVCLAVAEAIYIRVLFLFQKHNWIKGYTLTRRAAVYVLVTVTAVLAGAAVSYFDMGDVGVLKKQFPSHNQTYEEDDTIHVMTIGPKQFHDLVIYVIVFCGGFSSVGIFICLSVYPISLRRHNNLNYDKVNNEKSFTIMLIIQCLMPLIYIGAPFFTALLSWSPSFAEDSSSLRYIPTAVWIFFPLLNSACSIFLLEPYRRYVARLFGCTQRNRSVVPSIVVHGVDSARPEILQNNPVSSVEQPQPPEEPQQEIPEEKEVEADIPEPRRTYPIRLPPLTLTDAEEDTPRRFSLETDTVPVPTRERRPSVFSRLSYFL